MQSMVIKNFSQSKSRQKSQTNDTTWHHEMTSRSLKINPLRYSRIFRRDYLRATTAEIGASRLMGDLAPFALCQCSSRTPDFRSISSVLATCLSIMPAAKSRILPCVLSVASLFAIDASPRKATKFSHGNHR
jgi:hypothetical protein